MTFNQKLDAIVEKNNSLLCIGLDPVEDQLSGQSFFDFNKSIIGATHDLVCAFKPNSAFYEALGEKGIGELKKTCDYLRKNYRDIPIILDAKRGDIGSTNEGYVKFIFDYLKVDAVTLHSYLGKEALEPFLKQKDKGCIILCKTSNPGAGEFQDLNVIANSSTSLTVNSVKQSKPLYLDIAENVSKNWNKNNNCLLVVGATYPEDLAKVRKIAGDMTFLVPGIGAQGGDIKKTIKSGLNSKNAGMIINSSRGIIFSENPRIQAEKIRDEINKYRI